jgi:hypothetical protein
MPIVAQGGTVILEASVGHSNGYPADDPALTMTIYDALGVAVAGFPVAIPPIVRDDLGAYHYDWAVPIALPVGDYTATWDATVDSADAGGSEQVEVVAPGTVDATYLTLAELRTFITTDLADAPLQDLLSASRLAIIWAIGADGSLTERSHPNGDLLMLSWPASGITTVVEDDVTLHHDDYELSSTGMTLRRLDDGTNPGHRWHGWVEVTYVRADDAAERRRVQVALVKLEISFQPGLAAQQIGTWSETYASGKPYAEQRAEILASLGGGGWLV